MLQMYDAYIRKAPCNPITLGGHLVGAPYILHHDLSLTVPKHCGCALKPGGEPSPHDMSRSYMRRVTSRLRRVGFNGLDLTDGTAIHTAETQTLPRKVFRGTVEIIMNFKSSASFTSHGSLLLLMKPFISSSRRAPTFCHVLKHERCHVQRLCEAVEKPLCLYPLEHKRHHGRGTFCPGLNYFAGGSVTRSNDARHRSVFNRENLDGI